MSAKDTGGSAFPVNAWDGPNEQMIWPETGMTLRDWFAGQALAGLLACPDGFHLNDSDGNAARAYEYADAMLAERAK